MVAHPGAESALPWIVRAPGGPYLMEEGGAPWTPVGQNDSIAWVEFAGLYGRRDLDGVARHLAWLREHGVTCLRLMLEDSQTGRRYFEKPAGRFNPRLVRAWDDLFRLCKAAGMRILLTPYDTYWHWVRWGRHPYNARNGGPLAHRTGWLICPATRKFIKGRLRFAAERWGGSGALFAWDLWNEMHPVQGGDVPTCFADYIGDVGPFLRRVEEAAHGRAHLQGVSVFGPELGWKPWLNEPIFRHPALDFANSHFYEQGTIDHPRDTVGPALAVGRLVREALGEIGDQRPFFDTEHGPIHTFKDKKRTLPEAFDDEYFRHIQWAHLASGGAGGGMRWPNRDPHRLTPGMRQAQRAMAAFLPLVDWPRFDRHPLDRLAASDPDLACFGCGDQRQAVLFLLRRTPLLPDGRVDPATSKPASVVVPGLADGAYRATVWNTRDGRAEASIPADSRGGTLRLDLPALGADAAVAVRQAT